MSQVNTGFYETLQIKNKPGKTRKNNKTYINKNNDKFCKSLFFIRDKIGTEYFIPSQIPNFKNISSKIYNKRINKKGEKKLGGRKNMRRTNKCK